MSKPRLKRYLIGRETLQSGVVVDMAFHAPDQKSADEEFKWYLAMRETIPAGRWELHPPVETPEPGAIKKAAK